MAVSLSDDARDLVEITDLRLEACEQVDPGHPSRLVSLIGAQVGTHFAGDEGAVKILGRRPGQKDQVARPHGWHVVRHGW